MKKNWVGKLLLLVAATMLILPVSQTLAFEPENPECIAPAGPGGGWDFICRTTAKNLFQLGLIENAMQVANMSGGGAA